MWRVSGSRVQDTCYFTELGDSGHTHSKDVTFRITTSGELQYKAIVHTTGRILEVFDVVASSGSYTS